MQDLDKSIKLIGKNNQLQAFIYQSCKNNKNIIFWFFFF
jgi:hypothetical protein